MIKIPYSNLTLEEAINLINSSDLIPYMDAGTQTLYLAEKGSLCEFWINNIKGK